MKKTIAIILILTLSFACVSLASAEKGKEYRSSFLQAKKLTSTKLTYCSSNRINIAGLILLEYAATSRTNDRTAQKVCSTGTCYVVKYGSCLDIYYPTSSGKYLNLFVTPGSAKFKDYGMTSFSSGGYTYYKVSMKSVWDKYSEYWRLFYGS